MLRRLGAVVVLSGAFLLIGCGGSEEATQEQGVEGQEPAVAEQPAQEAAPMDQALTSFIGEKEPEPAKTEPEPVKTEPAPVQEPVADNQLEDLRTENTTLKQRLMKLEQDAQMMSARLSENETKLAAEMDRANKAEDALKNLPATPAPKAIATGSYEDALNAFMSKRYDESQQMLQGLLDAGVARELEDNCKYWIGENLFARKQYANAIENFEAVLQYKVSEKKADAQYMIAQCLERTGKKVQAKEAFEKVVKNYPMSNLVKKAKERWARL